MKNNVKRYIFIFSIALFALGCKHTDNTEPNSEDTKAVENKQPKSETLCFRNESTFKTDSTKKDVQELRLEIKGNEVTGEYNWLPAEKDIRKGTIIGTLSNNLVDAQYTFMQEGKENNSKIQIKLGNKKAEITGGDPALGLEATLEKVDCVIPSETQ